MSDKSPLKRILANTAWLLGGKGFGAVCGLAYLAILTRSLGLKDFGHFSLIFGMAQALIAIASFETWRVVVRYGAEYVHEQDWPKFGRLGTLCGLIDVLGAILGCLVAYVVVYGFGDMLEINPHYRDVAFYFSCAMLWAVVSAPTGMVRALHRFDKAVYVEAIVPSGRLIAALIIWWTGPSVAKFLFAWALIDLIEAACYWAMARHLSPQTERWTYVRQWRQALAENPGVLRFFIVTHAGGSIDAIMRHGPLLAVGGLVSTKAAGLYRLASQLTQALGKLSSLLTRSVYAEVARVRVAANAEDFRRVAIQTSKIAALAGGVVVALALAIGGKLLELIGGPEFAQGSAILVPLAIGASFELASVAFEPVLHTSGKAGRSLMARIVGVIALGIGIVAFWHQGGSGIAWAVALGSAVTYVALGLAAYFTLKNDPMQDEAADPVE